MALKTFNIDAQIYKEFSEYCKQNGISMSKQVENFFKEELMKIKLNLKEDKKKIEIEKINEKQEKTLIEEHPLSKYC